jgi:large subunit ribosomal protein L19
MNAIGQIEDALTPASPPAKLYAGDTVRVHCKIQEGGKTRIQVYEGTVIRIRAGGPRTTVTVRKTSFGVGVERIFPLYSPWIESIEVKSHNRVRRAKLYYLRGLKGRAARLREERGTRG